MSQAQALPASRILSSSNGTSDGGSKQTAGNSTQGQGQGQDQTQKSAASRVWWGADVRWVSAVGAAAGVLAAML